MSFNVIICYLIAFIWPHIIMLGDILFPPLVFHFDKYNAIPTEFAFLLGAMLEWYKRAC